MVPIMDLVANQVYQESYNSEIRPGQYIQVRITALAQSSRIRDLGPDDIDKLICITGLVIRNSEIIPEMREVFTFF